MAQLKDTTVNTTGYLQLPVGTTAQRPGSPVAGQTRFNTDTNQVEFYDGSQWSVALGPPGTNPNNPISSLSDISQSAYSGVVPLYTDLGGAVDPFVVLVDFTTGGGPYIVLSFNFDSRGFTDFNKTLAGNTSGTNDFIIGSGRMLRSNNIGLGLGSVAGTENFHPIEAITDQPAGSSAEASASTQTGTISYFNHATQNLLSAEQETAMRNWVQQLSSDTPHAGVIVDSDGGARGLTQPYDVGSFFAPASGGHSCWAISGSDIVLLTPQTDNTDEHHCVNLWTHNSHTPRPSSGSVAGTAVPAGEGLANINTTLLLPESYRGYTYTGGGWIMGTPYNPNALGGTGNFLSDRTCFLIRD